jgi:hypothetical protein
VSSQSIEKSILETNCNDIPVFVVAVRAEMKTSSVAFESLRMGVDGGSLKFEDRIRCPSSEVIELGVFFLSTSNEMTGRFVN